jgi:hypothetical protein
MTVKVNSCRGDGTYYLCDPAHELDGLREGPPGTVLAGAGTDARTALSAMLGTQVAGEPGTYDVIVAAPKTVSLLLALEPEGSARALVALHERSVRAALSYLIDDALGPGATATAVGFTHGVSRQLDPHLHTHVLVGARDRTGEPMGLGAIRSHASAANALYLSELRAGVEGAVGRTAWLNPWGRTFVEGVDYALVAHASAPRERDGRIERDHVKRHPTRDEVRDHWRAQLERHEPVGLNPTAPPASRSIDEYRFARALGLGFVRRRDVVRAWADADPRGEVAATVRASASLVAQLEGPGDRMAAVVVRDASGVRVLGPRPRDPLSLEGWSAERAALDRYLAAGHRLSHALDPRGAPASTRLALATLDAARASRTPQALTRGWSRELEGRSVS